MGKPLRALIIEDSEDDAVLLTRALRLGGYDPLIERVDTAEALRIALHKQEWDIVFSDYSMPNFSTPQALKILKESGNDLPFILVTGTIGEDHAAAVMKAGAHDFFLKGDLVRLVPAVERELREAGSGVNAGKWGSCYASFPAQWNKPRTLCSSPTWADASNT